MRTYYKTLFILSCLCWFGCKKFLDEKPDKSLVVPSSLTDLQAMLDNHSLMNASSSFALEIGSDDYYLKLADWQARNITERNSYIWAAESFNESVTPWAGSYAI